jgi:hypothetical protein
VHCEYTDRYGYDGPVERLSSIAPAALVVLWSSGFVGATMAARTAPAGTTLLWRYVVATLVMVAVVSVRGRRYPRSFLVREGVIGVLGQGGYLLGVFYAAERGLPAGTIALVASLQPALVALILSLTGERGGLRRVIGLGLGLVGVALVVGGGPAAGDGTAVVAAVLGMLSLSVATLIAQMWPADQRRDVIDSLAVQSVVALRAGLLDLGHLAGGAVLRRRLRRLPAGAPQVRRGRRERLAVPDARDRGGLGMDDVRRGSHGADRRGLRRGRDGRGDAPVATASFGQRSRRAPGPPRGDRRLSDTPPPWAP